MGVGSLQEVEMRIPILVAGGAGYIGAHTCKALAGAGYIPVTYDNLSTGHADFVRWGPFVEGDIWDFTKVTETCPVVWHCRSNSLRCRCYR